MAFQAVGVVQSHLTQCHGKRYVISRNISFPFFPPSFLHCSSLILTLNASELEQDESPPSSQSLDQQNPTQSL